MIPALEITAESRVLVVNDDFQELEALVMGLKLEGINAFGATTPANALELLSTTNFDVALIDLMMSEMNGLQLARKLRSRFPDVITMLMSDYLLSPVQLAKADTGVVGFVPKPCRFEELAGFVLSKIAKRAYREEAKSSSCSASDTNDSRAPFDVLSVQFSL